MSIKKMLALSLAAFPMVIFGGRRTRCLALRGIATALALALSAAAKPAAAGLIIDFNQVGADVVATASGSVDLTGLTYSFSAVDAAGVSGVVGGVAMGPAVS